MISLAVVKLREVKKPPIQVSSSGFVALFQFKIVGIP